MDDKKNTEDEGTESSGPTLEGKGWDILVGGENNLAAMGGNDPFDMDDTSSPQPFTAKAGSVQTSPSISQPDPQPAEVEPPPRDISPEELGYQPDPEGPTPTLEERGPDLLAEEATSVQTAEDLSPAMPGISAGVTVTPVEPGIIEVPPAEPLPSIVEVLPDSLDEPDEPIGGPISPPEGQLAEDVLAGPVAPAIEPVLSTPATPPWSIPQSIPIHDPFATEERRVYKEQVGGGSELPPNEALAKTLITQERIDALWDEINATYDLVVNDVRGHFDTTQQAIDYLKKARELLLSGPENFDNAEKLVMEVKSRLRLEEKVRQWSRTRGVWLATYLVLWLVLLSTGSLTTDRVHTFAMQFVPEWMAETWLPGLVGGLGGVIGALWVLNKHITKKRDFDPIHTMWYVTNPIMGIALGVGTYFIVRGGGWVLTSVAASGDFNLTIPVRLSLYALCLIVGFQQNVLWTLVDRFIKAIIPSTEEQAATDDTALPPVEEVVD
ncbi:MAG: hypothetical protein JXB30_11900 [Anaerolineae bacterium]|nr:hypothetical protein [Anaerolineae bacterium]